MFNNEKILLIESMPEGDNFIVFLFQLICESAKKGTGRLVFKVSDKVEMTDNVLAIVFDRDEKFITKSMLLFEEIGIITRKFNSIEIHKFWIKTRNRSSSNYINWRNEVFKRDDYTCQKCGVKAVKLNAHHIKKWSEYPSLRFETTNGVTLCLKCHKSVHRKR